MNKQKTVMTSFFMTGFFFMAGFVGASAHAETCQMPQFEDETTKKVWDDYISVLFNEGQSSYFSLCGEEAEKIKAIEKEKGKYQVILPKNIYFTPKGEPFYRVINGSDITLDLSEKRNILSIAAQQQDASFIIQSEDETLKFDLDFDKKIQFDTKYKFFKKMQVAIKEIVYDEPQSSFKELFVKWNDLSYTLEAKGKSKISRDSKFSTKSFVLESSREGASFRIGEVLSEEVLLNFNLKALNEAVACATDASVALANASELSEQEYLSNFSTLIACHAKGLENQDNAEKKQKFEFKDISYQLSDGYNIGSASIDSVVGDLDANLSEPSDYQLNIILNDLAYQDLDIMVESERVKYSLKLNDFPMGSVSELLQCGSLTSGLNKCLFEKGKELDGLAVDYQISANDGAFRIFGADEYMKFGQYGTKLALNNLDLAYDISLNDAEFKASSLGLPPIPAVKQATLHLNTNFDKDALKGASAFETIDWRNQPLNGNLEIILVDDNMGLKADAKVALAGELPISLEQPIEDISAADVELDLVVFNQDGVTDMIAAFVPYAAYGKELSKLYSKDLGGDKTGYLVTFKDGHLRINDKMVPKFW